MKSQLLILLSHASAPLSCADLSLATRRDKSAIVAALRGMIAKGVVDRVPPAEMDVMRYRLTPLGTKLAAAPKEPREPLRAILKVVLTESEERACCSQTIPTYLPSTPTTAISGIVIFNESGTCRLLPSPSISASELLGSS